MEEIWKDIKGYEDYYQVSNTGLIKCKKRRRITKGHLVFKGSSSYYMFILRYGDKNKYSYIHRLVAQHFIPRQEGKDCVDHIDRDSTNNHITNLRWCNKRENSFNSLGKSKKDKTSKYRGVSYSKQRKKWVASIKVDGKSVSLGRFDSEEEAKEVYNSVASQYHGEFFYM